MAIKVYRSEAAPSYMLLVFLWLVFAAIAGFGFIMGIAIWNLFDAPYTLLKIISNLLLIFGALSYLGPLIFPGEVFRYLANCRENTFLILSTLSSIFACSFFLILAWRAFENPQSNYLLALFPLGFVVWFHSMTLHHSLRSIVKSINSTAQKAYKSYTEKDHRGTRYDTESNAIWGWQRRLNLGGKSPFVTYTFDNEKAAKEAFLELPCFHIATDSQKLICTEVLEFAYFQTSDGKYDVGIWGDGLTYKFWELAKLSFSKHGGQMKDQLEPEKGVGNVSKREVMQFNKVKFVYIQEKQQKEKEEIIRRLRSVAARCGDFSLMIVGIADAIETGIDPYGKDAPSQEEIAALAGFAEMLEKEGKKSEAIELVFIAKAIQNIIEK